MIYAYYYMTGKLYTDIKRIQTAQEIVYCHLIRLSWLTWVGAPNWMFCVDGGARNRKFATKFDTSFLISRCSMLNTISVFFYWQRLFWIPFDFRLRNRKDYSRNYTVCQDTNWLIKYHFNSFQINCTSPTPIYLIIIRCWRWVIATFFGINLTLSLLRFHLWFMVFCIHFMGTNSV